MLGIGQILHFWDWYRGSLIIMKCYCELPTQCPVPSYKVRLPLIDSTLPKSAFKSDMSLPIVEHGNKVYELNAFLLVTSQVSYFLKCRSCFSRGALCLEYHIQRNLQVKLGWSIFLRNSTQWMGRLSFHVLIGI